ncbi:HepT-like ribonuclease domain-containing protein, partial [Candidatus Pollutiaquabacter sp.]|uniref:HepT-like ribonuclease domain-containing protein n=1 Tax=Candidatus Pollutiaquabacter sp. TaxID=3416354 RepID=UPI003CA56872|nr:DUF86 domain-containing protein [Bacteroidota bacterium]
MEEEINAWLADILNAIGEIEAFLPVEKNFLTFQEDLRTRRAIERNIEIMGESMSRILRVRPEISISSARKIVDTRNRISHGYDSVSAEILWSIVIRDLPLLKREVQLLCLLARSGRSRTSVWFFRL